MSDQKTNDLLIPAIRQYRHNYGSEELLFGYDVDEVDKVVGDLSVKVEELHTALRNLLNDCINFGGEDLTQSILERATGILNKGK